MKWQWYNYDDVLVFDNHAKVDEFYQVNTHRFEEGREGERPSSAIHIFTERHDVLFGKDSHSFGVAPSGWCNIHYANTGLKPNPMPGRPWYPNHTDASEVRMHFIDGGHLYCIHPKHKMQEKELVYDYATLQKDEYIKIGNMGGNIHIFIAKGRAQINEKHVKGFEYCRASSGKDITIRAKNEVMVAIITEINNDTE